MGIDGARMNPEKTGNRLAAVLIIPLTLVLAVLVGVFFVAYRTTIVEGDSMVPTLQPQDRLLVTKTYGAARRGDIVQLTTGGPEGEHDVLKRVVGLPGDRIEMRGSTAYVNGQPETYPFTLQVEPSRPDYVFGPVTVPQGTVFVLGDNRPISLDSRYTGPVPREQVLGRVVAVFAPVPRIQRIDYGP